MIFDLYTILVDQLIGGFGLTVLVLAMVIFLIMGVMGKMSRITVIYYESLFFLTMFTGFGYKLFSILIGFLLLAWLYLEFRNSTSG